MTDSERLWTGVAVSLFLHFSLTLWHPAAEEEKSVFRAVLEMDSRPSALPDATRQGTGRGIRFGEQPGRGRTA